MGARHVQRVKIRESGKEHRKDDSNCPSCIQHWPGGHPINKAHPNRHYPYRDPNGTPPCGGMVHSEWFSDENEMVLYCFKCITRQ
jgi:hypothetical protein